MKIGIDARSLTLFKTGIGIYLSEILDCWRKSDIPSKVCLFSNREAEIPWDRPFEKRIANKGLGLPWYLFQSHHEINQYRPDVFWGTQFLLPRWLSRDIPAVVTIEDCVHRLGFAYAPSVLHNLLHRHYIPAAINRAARILTISKFVADEIAHCYGVSPKRIEVTPLGVNPIFQEEQIDRDKMKEVLRRHGIVPPFILGVGTLEPRKNLKLLLEAYARLPHMLRESYCLVLVGKSGWKGAEIKRQISVHPCASRIRLVGYLPRTDLPFFYAAASMFVFPSFYEGFGLPVLEAMAAGCPVISSNSSSLKELVGDSGLTLSPHRSAQEWAELMEHLATTSSLASELRMKGLARASVFSWSACATRTHEVLQESAYSGI
jgi:glycosyltransferase involved in cell wall biosynthesis